MKCLTSSGLGRQTTEASKTHDLRRKERDNEPKTLVNTLVYLFGKFFALRSGGEHRSLTFAQPNAIEGDVLG